MAISEKTIAILDKWISELGTREAGMKIIDNYFRKMVGLSVSDLPDTATLMNGLDEIEASLEGGQGNYANAIQTAIETAKEMLEDEGFSGMFENKENKKPIMKRVKFKNKFTSIQEALTKVPDVLKKNNKIFEMTDGNKTLKVRWEGTLTEGRAVALTAKDDVLINEDILNMKRLMGYKPQDIIGNHKGTGRVMENNKFTELLSISKKKILTENSGNIEIVDESEILDEGLKGIMAGIMALVGGIASGQQLSPETVNNVKTELSQLSPEQKEVIGDKLTPEQLKSVTDATGINFTADAANDLFKWEPEAPKANKTPAPKLYLGKYGDINAAKVIKVTENGKGGFDYLVEISGVYAHGENFNKIRTYIGKNNTKLSNVNIEFINDKGSPYSGKDITYK